MKRSTKIVDGLVKELNELIKKGTSLEEALASFSYLHPIKLAQLKKRAALIK